MKEILDYLKTLRKEDVTMLVYLLIEQNVITFHEVAEMHACHMEKLRKQSLDELMHLRSEIVNLYCGTKGDLPKSVIGLIEKMAEKGQVNITEEQIAEKKKKWRSKIK